MQNRCSAYFSRLTSQVSFLPPVISLYHPSIVYRLLPIVNRNPSLEQAALRCETHIESVKLAVNATAGSKGCRKWDGGGENSIRLIGGAGTRVGVDLISFTGLHSRAVDQSAGICVENSMKAASR